MPATKTIAATARTPEITVTTFSSVNDEIKSLAESMPSRYLRRFLAEKDIAEVTFEFELNGTYCQIPNTVVVEQFMVCSAVELKQVEIVLTKIDFANGDVNHFFAHLALGIASNQV